MMFLYYIYRSQKDPLAADEEAPQRVLVPIEQTFHKELEKYDEVCHCLYTC